MQRPQLKNLFVPFSPDRESGLPDSVAYALSLMRAAEAHATIRAYGLKYEPPYSFASGFVGSLVGPANAEERKRLDSAVEALGKRLAAVGGPHDMAAEQLPLVTLVEHAAVQARLHDLSIIDAPHEYFVFGRALIEELLFHTGRPLICVPSGANSFKASRILLAWDGTANAARALGDAMPILRCADHVEIVSVTNEKDLSKLVPGSELAPHLARHGLKVTVSGVEAMDGDAGAALRSQAASIGADLIVMGAFAHSRWRQMVLGGVTDSMLRHAQIPVLMSH